MASVYELMKLAQMQSGPGNLTEAHPGGGGGIIESLSKMLQQKEEKAAEKQKNAISMYKTLRDAGYSQNDAYEAVMKGTGFPKPSGPDVQQEKETTELSKSKADLAKTEAETTRIKTSTDNMKRSGLPFDVQEGQVPEGMEIVGYDQKGQPMIRKIKVDVGAEKLKMAQEDRAKQLEAESQLVLTKAQDSLDAIAEVEKGMEFFGMKSYLPAIPGSKKATWDAYMNQLLAGKIIDVMTQMKQASKTGATGFGQLNRSELKVLQDASTALKKTLSADEARKILNKMKTMLKKVTKAKFDKTDYSTLYNLE